MSKDIETTEKKALEKTDETTWAGETYQPTVDIWESEDALVLQADVPGVKKDDVEINLDKDVLTISGRVALDEYEGLRPVYSEFGVGNFYRRFSLGETIDQAAITADMNDGVLTVTLPKREKAQPRKITVT
ncbi:MAG: Hsp20/alpha crystallin family protein [Candidatus Sulfomarinibacteraceae bacterium]